MTSELRRSTTLAAVILLPLAWGGCADVERGATPAEPDAAVPDAEVGGGGDAAAPDGAPEDLGGADGGGADGAGADGGGAPPSFADAVHPLLEAECSICHGPNEDPSFLGEGPEADRQKLLDDGLVEPGSPDDSPLYRKATGQDGHEGGTILEPGSEDAMLIRAWIEADAPL